MDRQDQLVSALAELEVQERAALCLGGHDPAEAFARRVVVAEAHRPVAADRQQGVAPDHGHLRQSARQLRGAQRAGDRCLVDHESGLLVEMAWGYC
jgi:hypothetical protein